MNQKRKTGGGRPTLEARLRLAREELAGLPSRAHALEAEIADLSERVEKKRARQARLA